MLPAALAASALALLLLAAPAAQAGPGRLVVTTESKLTTVAAGQSKRLFLGCPRGSVALAGASAPPVGVARLSSVPGASRWGFRFENVGTADRRVRGLVRCLEVAPPDDVRRLRYGLSIRRKRAALGAGGAGSVGVRCRRGHDPTAYGARYESPAAGRGTARLYEAIPVAAGYDFALAETAGAPTSLDLFVRCLARRGTATTAAGGSQSFDIDVLRRRFRDGVRSGGGRIRHSCRRGDYALGAGFGVDPLGGANLVAARPEGARGTRWLFRNAGARAEVRTFLLCLDGRSSFG